MNEEQRSLRLLTQRTHSPCASYSSTALTSRGQERRKRPELKVVLDGWNTNAWGKPCWQRSRGPPAHVTCGGKGREFGGSLLMGPDPYMRTHTCTHLVQELPLLDALQVALRRGRRLKMRDIKLLRLPCSCSRCRCCCCRCFGRRRCVGRRGRGHQLPSLPHAVGAKSGGQEEGAGGAAEGGRPGRGGGGGHRPWQG